MIILPKIHNPKTCLQAASENAVPKSVLDATRAIKVTLLEIQTDVIHKRHKIERIVTILNEFLVEITSQFL